VVNVEVGERDDGVRSGVIVCVAQEGGWIGVYPSIILSSLDNVFAAAMAVSSIQAWNVEGCTFLIMTRPNSPTVGL
jgi:hypothetical protein